MSHGYSKDDAHRETRSGLPEIGSRWLWPQGADESVPCEVRRVHFAEEDQNYWLDVVHGTASSWWRLDDFRAGMEPQES